MRENKNNDLIKFDLSPEIKIAEIKKIIKKIPAFLYLLFLIKKHDTIRLKLNNNEPAFISLPIKPDIRWNFRGDSNPIMFLPKKNWTNISIANIVIIITQDLYTNERRNFYSDMNEIVPKTKIIYLIKKKFLINEFWKSVEKIKFINREK